MVGGYLLNHADYVTFLLDIVRFNSLIILEDFACGELKKVSLGPMGIDDDVAPEVSAQHVICMSVSVCLAAPVYCLRLPLP